MKKLSLTLSLAMLVSFVGADVAGATCVAGGKVSRLRTGAIVGNFVDIQQYPSNLPAFATFYVVPTTLDYSLLAAAQAGNLTVFVTGDAVSCPTTGTFRSGGTVIDVDIFRNQ
jgi:hypothetical protein